MIEGDFAVDGQIFHRKLQQTADRRSLTTLESFVATVMASACSAGTL
jgi:hypothetical protein